MIFWNLGILFQGKLPGWNVRAGVGIDSDSGWWQRRAFLAIQRLDVPGVRIGRNRRERGKDRQQPMQLHGWMVDGAALGTAFPIGGITRATAAVIAAAFLGARLDRHRRQHRCGTEPNQRDEHHDWSDLSHTKHCIDGVPTCQHGGCGAQIPHGRLIFLRRVMPAGSLSP